MNSSLPVFMVLIPILLMLFFLSKMRQRRTLIPSLGFFTGVSQSLRIVSRRHVRGLLVVVTLGGLAAAALGPYRDRVVEHEEERRNIMLALDVSGSMRAHDIPGASQRASRLDAIKYVIKEFINRRESDRIGLVVFGSAAYLQAPLTTDYELLLSFVDTLYPGMAGEGTAMGDGLGISLKHIAELPGLSRAIILVTDGVNNSGQANPTEAASVAKEMGIKVHVIGVGGGGRGEAEYDESTLRSIAETTGGVFFNARSVEDLQKIYNEIDTLEETDASENKMVRESLSFIPLVICALSFFALHVLTRSYFVVVP